MRNHLLTGLAGLMIGFVAGYLLQETLAAGQPQRLVHKPGAAAVGQGGPGGGTATGVAAGMEQVRRLREYVAENPNDPDAVLQLGLLNFQIQQWPRAGELFERFLELRPDNPDVLSDLGICLREMGDYQQALAHFDRAQEIEPGHWASHFNEVVVQAFELGDYDAAGSTLREMRELQPDNPDIERLAAEIERRRNAA